jgi:two-component system cell cycle response regulator DivK
MLFINMTDIKILLFKTHDELGDYVWLFLGRMKRKGFAVTRVYNYQQILEFFRKERPVLLLLDIAWLAEDDLATLKKLKITEGIRNIPIIGLTAHSMSDGRKKAISAGCDEHDTLPIELSRLLEKIHRLLK